MVQNEHGYCNDAQGWYGWEFEESICNLTPTPKFNFGQGIEKIHLYDTELQYFEIYAAQIDKN